MFYVNDIKFRALSITDRFALIKPTTHNKSTVKSQINVSQTKDILCVDQVFTT